MLLRTFLSLSALIAAISLLVPRAHASDVNFGFLASYSGPTGKLAPTLADGMQMALLHVNNQGGLHGGQNAVMITANSRCDTKSRAVSAAEQLIGSESVVGIIGGLCSGTTLAAGQGFTIPTGTPMISPASQSPALTGMQDNDLVFRTIASQNAHAKAVAQLVEKEGLKQVSVIYSSDDAQKLAFETFKASLSKSAPHQITVLEIDPDNDNAVADAGKWLISNGGDLVVFGDPVADSQLQEIISTAAGLRSIRHLYFGDPFDTEALIKSLPHTAYEKLIFLAQQHDHWPGAQKFRELALNMGLDPDFPFLANTYDGAFILALAEEFNGVSGDEDIAAAIRKVANSPGEVILPGEWHKALKLIAEGKDIDYEGASGPIEFDENGDLVLSFRKAIIADGKLSFLDITN